MPDIERINRGRDFEKRIASLTAEGRTVAGSGNRYDRKGDNTMGRLLVSAKAEAKRTWGRTKRQYREAREMCLGTGRLPALAILDDDGDELVVIGLSDFIELISEDPVLTRAEDDTGRRRLADVPSVLRD